MQKNMKKARMTGKIRSTPIQPPTYPSQQLPQSIKDITIDNINLYKEMKCLDNYGQHIFDKYQQIIKDLQQIITDLEERNSIINGERLQLMIENQRLREEVQGMRDGRVLNMGRVVHGAYFDVVNQEETISAMVGKNSKKNSNQILQQSQFDLGNIHHHLSKVSAQLSIQSPHAPKSHPSNPSLLTPHLPNPYTLLQSKINNNQTPLRIFYLLLLQQKSTISKLRELLSLCIQDQSKVLLYLLPKDNQLWGRILEKFIQNVENGAFQDQKCIIGYIEGNPLLDLLLVSLLKQCLPVENQDEQLNLGDWKADNIDHRALFRGLCNQFDFIFEQDTINRTYKFYPNLQKSKYSSSSISQQCLLQSRQKHPSTQTQNIDISLFSRQNLQSSTTKTYQQPYFKIQIDREQKYYQYKITIRHCKEEENEDEYGETSSFKNTEKGEEEQEEEEEEISQGLGNMGSCEERRGVDGGRGGWLRPRDLNRECRSIKKYQDSQHDYLRPNQQSKDISRNQSKHISRNSSSAYFEGFSQ